MRGRSLRHLAAMGFVVIVQAGSMPAATAVPRTSEYTAWPQFHFNTAHTGYNLNENVINASNVSSLESAWKTSLPCTSYSGPVIAYRTVYFGNYCNAVYAVDEQTGTLRWTAPTGGKVDATPAVANGLVFAASSDNRLYAFDAATGTQVWTYATGGALTGADSPTVKKGVVYVGSEDDNVYAINVSDGTLKWKVTTGGAVQSSPAVRKGMVYAGSSDGNLYAIDAATGAVLWTGSADGSLFSPTVTSWTGHAGTFVFVGSSTGNLYAFRARGCGQSACSPEWVGPLGIGTSASNSAAAAYGRLFIGASDGSVYAFDAGGCGSDTCSPVWIGSTGGSIGAGPAVAGGVVYTGSSFTNAIYGFDAKTGALLWSYSGGSTPYGGDTSPAITNGTVFVILTWEFSVDAFRLP